MRTNTLKLLAVILAVLLCISAWLLVRPDGRVGGEDPCFKDVAGSNVVRLVRTRGAKTEELVRTDGGGWLFGTTSVRADEPESFLQSIGKVRGVRVARSGREVPAYGLRSDTATRVSLVTAKSTTTCDVGRTDPASGGAYVASEGSDSVYLVRGTTINDFVRADWNTWRTSSTSNATGTAVQR